MNSTLNYLAHNYLDLAQLAQLSNVSKADILAMIDAQLIPGASYWIDDQGMIFSAAFGELTRCDLTNNTYFHSSTVVWITQATTLKNRVGMTLAPAEFNKQFAAEFEHCYRQLQNEVIATLTNSHITFLAEVRNKLHSPELLSKCTRYFMQGIFGLCVAAPYTMRVIAKKEVLQQLLTIASSNMDQISQQIDSIPVWRAFIQEYAQLSMPFSPDEYPRSSRKRLCEDFSEQLLQLAP
jgi:hypothetical protein